MVCFSFMFLLSLDYWEIQTTKHKGRGVFAKKDIAAGTIIGDYLGKLIRKDDEDKYEEKYGFYAMYYHERATVFPDVKKPGIHLINHSCTPNCYMYTYQGHTLYFALRHIFAGEELNVSYLVSPLDDDCSPCTHLCKCGSDLCTNTMHTTTRQYDTWSDFDNENMKDIKLPRVTYGKDLEKLSSYPEAIPDNPVYPLYGYGNKPPYLREEKKLPSQTKIRKLIRETGQELQFSNLGITIRGVVDNQLIAKALQD